VRRQSREEFKACFACREEFKACFARREEFKACFACREEFKACFACREEFKACFVWLPVRAGQESKMKMALRFVVTTQGGLPVRCGTK
jgi:hypothetical protein